MNENSAPSCQGCDLDPGLGFAPGGSAGSRPPGTRTPTILFAGSPALRYFLVKVLKSVMYGGSDVCESPNGIVMVKNRMCTEASPCSGGPTMGRSAPRLTPMWPCPQTVEP